MTKALNTQEVQEALVDLPGWKLEGSTLERTFTFTDFRAAMAFMVHASYPCEGANHHPEWTNVYNRVEVRFTTHDAGSKVTDKDLGLALVFNQLAAGKTI